MIAKNFDIYRTWKFLKSLLKRKSLHPRIADAQGTQPLDKAGCTFVMLVAPNLIVNDRRRLGQQAVKERHP